MKTGFLMYVILVVYRYIYMSYVLTTWYFDTPLASSLNLADLPFFIYNVSQNNFHNYFLSEYAIFDFWNAEF